MSMKHTHMSKGVSSQTLGGRNDLIYPDDVDSIEFCVRNDGINGAGDAFNERRRRGHSRRSNHKMQVDHHV